MGGVGNVSPSKKMADLTEGEKELFAKYWGQEKLEENEEFWEDIYQYLSTTGRDVPLPISYNPSMVRQVQDLVNCPAGECGKCCHYPKVYVDEIDITRIIEHTLYKRSDLLPMLRKDNKGFYIDASKGCPFLKDNLCTIYKYRPDTCYFFPLQVRSGKNAEGEKIDQMLIRVICRPALNAVKQIMKEATKRGDRILLPDLSLVTGENNGTGTTMV